LFAETVIKLKDNCPGFSDPPKPKIVVLLHEGQGTATDAESLGGLSVLLENANTLSLHADPNAVMLVAVQAE
jgi:hypothetical protein